MVQNKPLQTVFSRYVGSRPIVETSISDIPSAEQEAFWLLQREPVGEMSDEDANRLYDAWQVTQESYGFVFGEGRKMAGSLRQSAENMLAQFETTGAVPFPNIHKVKVDDHFNLVAPDGNIVYPADARTRAMVTWLVEAHGGMVAQAEKLERLSANVEQTSASPEPSIAQVEGVVRC